MFEVFFGAHPLAGLVAVLHGAALVSAAPGILFKKQSLAKIGLVLLAAAFALNTWWLVDRWIESDRPPFKTLFETLLFYPWCVALVTLVLIALHRLHFLIPFAAAVSLAGIAYALYRPDVEVVNLPPALQSAWFVPHVVTYFVAYAALFASFAIALLALWSPSWTSGGPDLTLFAHRTAIFGVCSLTLGLVLGAVWGKYAWGDYWGWDAKENWALISWLAYVIYLHLRLMEGWHGRRSMWILVGAFAAVVFTYLGMNLLPSAKGSLHVYQ